MPFDYMTDAGIWDKEAVWDEACYVSKLKKAKSAEEQKAERKLLNETATVMGWRTFREIHDAYLMMDLCLADIMESFRAAFYSKFALDALQYVTLPSASYDAMKKSCLCREPARLITDPDIYKTVRQSIMGGLSCAFQTYMKANSPELGPDKYDENEPTSYGLQMDISSMYPYVMTMPLPISSGKKVALPEDPKARLEWVRELVAQIDYMNDSEDVCWLVKADFTFPLYMHDYLDWAPPAKMVIPPQMLSEYSRKVMRENDLQPCKCKKLVPYLGVHEEEGVDGKRLAFMIKVMGAQVLRVHEVIEFKCKPFLGEWMRSIYQERLEMKRSGRLVEAETLKLVLNSIYGKLIQRVEGFKHSRLYTSRKSWIKAVNGRRVKDVDIIYNEDNDPEFLGVVHNIVREVLQKSLVQDGWRVLELSRLYMLKIHYLGMKQIFPDAVVTLTDTDCGHYWIPSDEDPLHALARANEEPGKWPCFFDLAKDLVGKPDGEKVLAHLTPNQQRIAWERAGEIGGFGVEHLPRRVWEEINLRAKLCTTRFNDHKTKQRSKGIVKRSRPGHEAYRMAMARGRESGVSFSQLVSRQFVLSVVNLSKKALSPYNDKAFQVKQTENRPHGHWRNDEILVKIEATLGLEDKPFQLIVLFLHGRTDRKCIAELL